VTEVERLAELLRQAYEGDRTPDAAWHGPSIAALVSGVSAQQARRRIAPGTHTIWELVLHMAFWDEVCVQRLQGARLAVTTGSPEDWPAVQDATDADWDAAVLRNRRGRESLIRSLRQLADADLSNTVPDWGWTFYTMINGTLHHDVYHAGQIALIRASLSGAQA
jgi:uncharacterized damage-inducible protein DinB